MAALPQQFVRLLNKHLVGGHPGTQQHRYQTSVNAPSTRFVTNHESVRVSFDLANAMTGSGWTTPAQSIRSPASSLRHSDQTDVQVPEGTVKGRIHQLGRAAPHSDPYPYHLAQRDRESELVCSLHLTDMPFCWRVCSHKRQRVNFDPMCHHSPGALCF